MGAKDWEETIGPVEIASGHRHCHVPDPRLGSDFEYIYTEVYSVRLKRFPVFGRVVGVQWRDGSGGAAGPKDSYFSDLVADHLDQDSSVAEASMTAGLDLVVYIEPESWVICDMWKKNTGLAWDFYRAVAKSLTAMPMPAD